jgi:hypothetical protein
MYPETAKEPKMERYYKEPAPYTLKIKRDTEGVEGRGFVGTLYRDAKKVADVLDGGDGGGAWPRCWVSKEECAAFHEHVNNTPPFYFHGALIKHSVDSFLGQLEDRARLLKWARRKCKDAVVFKVRGDEEEAWRVIKQPLSRAILDHLEEKYHGAVIHVLNLDIGQKVE